MKKNILILDDNLVLLDIMAVYFSKEDIPSIRVTTAKEAIQIFEKYDIEYVISDYNLEHTTSEPFLESLPADFSRVAIFSSDSVKLKKLRDKYEQRNWKFISKVSNTALFELLGVVLRHFREEPGKDLHQED